jgi:hypothetical protein
VRARVFFKKRQRVARIFCRKLAYLITGERSFEIIRVISLPVIFPARQISQIRRFV